MICVAFAGVAAKASTARIDAPSRVVVTTGLTAPLVTGLGDPAFQGPQAALAYGMAREAGATYARIVASWASIAPTTLPVRGFDATDPTSPSYRWSALDASVAAAEAAGITPIINIVSPPDWAYSIKPGTWTGGAPRIADLGAFATALAAHYDGSGSSPVAHVFSVWNEPNFSKNLYPQDPTLYRSMVNAVADAVHGVDPSNLVLAGELAPGRHLWGNRDRNTAIPPLNFMRKMLCISNKKRPTRTCNTPAKFDVWAHHPYSDTGPFGKAKSKGGVELGDLPRMNALLQIAQRLGTIASVQPVQFWVTEFGWSSNPPNKNGTPIALESRWVAESLYQMWRSGVTLGIWFLLRDLPLTTPFQSGLYFRSSSLADADDKPLLTAFSFPFVAYLKPRGKVELWGRDTTSDMQEVTIEQQTPAGEPWTTVAVVKSNSYGIFQATLSLRARSEYFLRASAPGSGSSLPFSLTVPRNENRHVIPFPPN